MVWGMRLPNNFGEFWPSGEFEYDPKKKDTGWYDRLERHYLAQTSEEQLRLYDYRGLAEGQDTLISGARRYRTHPSRKLVYEVGTKDGPDSLPTTPVEAHEAPLSFDTDKVYAALGSMIMLNDRILAVDQALKTIIERLEPGVHKFFPIEIKTRRGKTTASIYYTLAIGQYLDSFSLENSSDKKKNVAGTVSLTGFAFSKEAFGKAHLWRDRRFPLLNCLSDELIEEISKAGLRIPKHYKMREV